MKVVNGKGLEGGRLSSRTGDRSVALRARFGTPPVVADPSTRVWKRYCETRLRHFASGR
jgi:hypothetical protein